MRHARLLLVAPVLMALRLPAPGAAPARPDSSAPSDSLPERAIGCYDEARQRVVMIGGSFELAAGSRDRMWSWSGTRWEPEGDAGPPSRGNAAIGCDAATGTLHFSGGAQAGGADGTVTIVAESWEGSAAGWRRATGADIDARDHHALAHDAKRDRLVLFGGIGATRSAPWPNDTWERQRGGWMRVATEGPPGRGRTGLAYDRARGQLVLFGGASAPDASGEQRFLDDTWVYEDATWRRVADGGPGGPRGRYAHGMVYDERAGVVLLYSGAAAHRNAPLADLWQWDGTRWTEVTMPGATPGHRYQPLMVYDRRRQRTVLYGGAPGRDRDTWEWDGRRWTRHGSGA